MIPSQEDIHTRVFLLPNPLPRGIPCFFPRSRRDRLGLDSVREDRISTGLRTMRTSTSDGTKRRPFRLALRASVYVERKKNSATLRFHRVRKSSVPVDGGNRRKCLRLSMPSGWKKVPVDSGKKKRGKKDRRTHERANAFATDAGRRREA